jgi:hypothetical protein
MLSLGKNFREELGKLGVSGIVRYQILDSDELVEARGDFVCRYLEMHRVGHKSVGW